MLAVEERYGRNAFLRIPLRRPLVCEAPAQLASATIFSPELLTFLAKLDGQYTWEVLVEKIGSDLGVDRADAEAIAIQMKEASLITALTGEEQHKHEMYSHWIERGWLDALALHLSAREIKFSDDGAHEDEQFNRDYQDYCADVTARSPDSLFFQGYPSAPFTALSTQLEATPAISFEEVLLKRRSSGPWRGGNIELEILSTMLRLANSEAAETRAAIRQSKDLTASLLLKSSFVALETYVVVMKSAEVEAGIYHYDIDRHGLSLIRSGQFADALSKFCIGQHHPRRAACAFLIAANWPAYMQRYRHARAYLNLLVNTSELAQKYIVSATSFGLSNFLTPALRDDMAHEFIGAGPFELGLLYVVAVG